MLHAIRSILKADASVYALVDERITTATRPQNQTLPAILLETDSIDTNESKTSTSGLDEVRFTLTTFADSYEGAYTLDTLSRAALDLFIGDIGSPSVAFNEIRYNSSSEDYFDTADTGVYHRSLTFTAYVKMTAGGASYPSGVNEPVDIDATDGSDVVTTLQTVASGATYTFSKISILQQDDSTLGFGRIDKDVKVTNADITTVTETATEIEVEVDVVVPSGIAYMQVSYPQKTSYNTYDIGWWKINRLTDLLHTPPTTAATIQALNHSVSEPFSTLRFNNIHGNLNRFTAQDGTQVVLSGGVIQDHLYYMEWINTQFSTAVLGTHLANAEADTTDGGATNQWRLASQEEIATLFDQNSTSGFPAIFPFTATNRWLSNRYPVSTTLQAYNWGGTLITRRSPGTYAYVASYCRKGTW